MRLLAFLLSITMTIAAPSTALADDEQEMVVGDRRREYRVHLPSGYSPHRRYPAIIVLHGAGASSKSIEKVTGMSDLADQEQFIAIYPEGTGTIKGWNAGICCGYAETHDVDDAGFLDALITRLQTTYAIDPERVYLAGFSNGAMLAYSTAARLQNKVAGLGIVEGSMSGQEVPPTKPMPVVIFHGTDDKRVAYTGGFGKFAKLGLKVNPQPVGYAVEFWKRVNQAQPTPKTTQQADVIKDEFINAEGKPVVILYTIIGGGHAWAGGEKSAPWGVKPVESISASKEMWQFFQQHQRAETQNAGLQQLVH